jgi:hypothetical protein
MSFNNQDFIKSTNFFIKKDRVVKLKRLETFLVLVRCFKNPPWYKHFDHFETSTMQNHYDKYVALFVKNKSNFKGIFFYKKCLPIQMPLLFQISCN